MIRAFLSLIILTAIACGHIQEFPISEKLVASNLSQMGRTLIRDTDVILISSSSGVEFFAKGDTLKIEAKVEGSTYNYLDIALNDAYYKRIKIPLDTVITVKIPLLSEKLVRVGLFKATEASIGDLVLRRVEAEQLDTIIPQRPLTIEYIGDSITCGMGADTTEIPCGSSNWFDQHNAYLAYGPITARELNADFILNSVSGMGMYRNWNDTTEPVMPDVYTNLRLNGDRSQRWYANAISPDLISICLGTNDFSDGDGIKDRPVFDQQKYVATYIDFVQELINVHPEVKIALLTSPMIATESDKGILLLNSLKQVKSHFEDVTTISIFEFEGIQDPGGCGYHPDLTDHQKMAFQLLPFYKNLLDL